MNETCSSSSHIVAGHLAHHDRSYLPAGYHRSNLISPLLAAFEVGVPDIALNLTPRDGPTVQSLRVEMLGLQIRTFQRDADTNVLRDRLCQRDANVRNLRRQVEEKAARLHEAISVSLTRHQLLKANSVEHRDRMQEVLERAATQCGDHIIEVAMTGIDHVLQHLWKRERKDDGADLSSGSNAIW